MAKRAWNEIFSSNLLLFAVINGKRPGISRFDLPLFLDLRKNIGMRYSREKFDILLCDRLNVPPEKIKPEARFKDDLGADSLDVVELTISLESAFNIIIPDEEAEMIATVGDAESCILRALDKNRP